MAFRATGRRTVCQTILRGNFLFRASGVNLCGSGNLCRQSAIGWRLSKLPKGAFVRIVCGAGSYRTDSKEVKERRPCAPNEELCRAREGGIGFRPARSSPEKTGWKPIPGAWFNPQRSRRSGRHEANVSY